MLSVLGLAKEDLVTQAWPPRRSCSIDVRARDPPRIQRLLQYEPRSTRSHAEETKKPSASPPRPPRPPRLTRFPPRSPIDVRAIDPPEFRGSSNTNRGVRGVTRSKPRAPLRLLRVLRD